MTEETINAAPNVAQQQAATDRPAWIPPKFKSGEDFARAYAELEKKQSSQPRSKLPEVPSQEAQKSALVIEDDDEARVAAERADLALEGDTDLASQSQQQAERVVEAAGLDVASLRSEFNATGDLSPESYEKLAKVGIDRETVAAYVAGQQARGELVRQDLAQSVGGEERLGQIIDWARFNLQPEEGDAWDRTLASGDHSLIRMGLASLKARWEAAGMDEPTGQLFGSRAGEHADVYEDRAALHADIARPEYRTSEAFRAKVTEKLRRSSI